MWTSSNLPPSPSSISFIQDKNRGYYACLLSFSHANSLTTAKFLYDLVSAYLSLSSPSTLRLAHVDQAPWTSGSSFYMPIIPTSELLHLLVLLSFPCPTCSVLYSLTRHFLHNTYHQLTAYYIFMFICVSYSLLYPQLLEKYLVHSKYSVFIG